MLKRSNKEKNLRSGKTVTHEGTRGGDGETRRHAGRRRSHTEACGEETVTHRGTRGGDGETPRHKIKRDSKLIRNCARQDTVECI